MKPKQYTQIYYTRKNCKALTLHSRIWHSFVLLWMKPIIIICQVLSSLLHLKKTLNNAEATCLDFEENGRSCRKEECGGDTRKSVHVHKDKMLIAAAISPFTDLFMKRPFHFASMKFFHVITYHVVQEAYPNLSLFKFYFAWLRNK